MAFSPLKFCFGSLLRSPLENLWEFSMTLSSSRKIDWLNKNKLLFQLQCQYPECVMCMACLLWPYCTLSAMSESVKYCFIASCCLWSKCFKICSFVSCTLFAMFLLFCQGYKSVFIAEYHKYSTIQQPVQ